MRFDTYTKGILTVIAACLLLLTANSLELLPTAKADSTQHHAPSMNEGYALVPVNEDGSIDVRVKAFDATETIDVNIEDADQYALQYAGPIEVRVDD